MFVDVLDSKLQLKVRSYLFLTLLADLVAEEVTELVFREFSLFKCA